MRDWSTINTQKESSRNLRSSMSKLWEIREILAPTDWDRFWVKVVKKNLLQLLINQEYKKFQTKIWMPEKLCDWMLWETSLNYLIRYIVWVEDGAENIVGETIKYIWNAFKFGDSQSKFMSEELPTVTTVKKVPEPTTTKKTPNIPADKNNAPKESEKISSAPMFGSIPLSKIQSYPTIKNEETENYCCSKTARINGLRFWISLPRWNAYTAWISPTTGIIESLPKEKSWLKPNKTWIALKEWEFNSIKNSANFADIYAESKTSYGHRAVAIRDIQWNWYLLDPYIKIDWKKSLKPIKLKDYITKWRKILKAHFYHSNWYIN